LQAGALRSLSHRRLRAEPWPVIIGQHRDQRTVPNYISRKTFPPRLTVGLVERRPRWFQKAAAASGARKQRSNEAGLN
jgi:hypothetical protein